MSEKLIVAIPSCSVGIAHTYMAAENLEKTGEAMGIKVKVEILYFNYNVGSSN